MIQSDCERWLIMDGVSEIQNADRHDDSQEESIVRHLFITCRIHYIIIKEIVNGIAGGTLAAGLMSGR